MPDYSVTFVFDHALITTTVPGGNTTHAIIPIAKATLAKHLGVDTTTANEVIINEHTTERRDDLH